MEDNNCYHCNEEFTGLRIIYFNPKIDEREHDYCSSNCLEKKVRECEDVRKVA